MSSYTAIEGTFDIDKIHFPLQGAKFPIMKIRVQEEPGNHILKEGGTLGLLCGTANNTIYMWTPQELNWLVV